MKMSSIAVGSREYGKAREVSVSANLADNIGDCIELATAKPCPAEVRDALKAIPADVQGIVAQKFNRAYRIAVQDGHLRPLYETGERKPEAFQAAMDALTVLPLSAIKSRGRPAKPQTVTLDAGKKSYSPAEVEALMAGLKNVRVVK